MFDIGLKLAFDDPASAVAFARELGRAEVPTEEFRIATLDPKLNFDADTLVMVLKVAGGAASAIAGFLSLSKAILAIIQRPRVKIEIGGNTVELTADASVEDIKSLCEILHRSGK
jgi:hypothetical protein